MDARCNSANVIPCSGCTIASAPGWVDDAITIHRKTAAIDAIAAAPPGPNLSTNRGPIRMKTMTSATTASDHRTLIMVGADAGRIPSDDRECVMHGVAAENQSRNQHHAPENDDPHELADGPEG
jgi:hypothetical protein